VHSTEIHPAAASLIRTARLERGLSQLKLASKADLSLATVGLAERHGLMSEAVAVRLARVLRVPVQALLGDHPRSRSPREAGPAR
jgi:transcriptional regulator with XRE-family HTH domain